MNKYQLYKPSSVEWIDEIPSHWKLTKTKYFSLFRNGYSFKSEDWVDDGVPVIRMSNIGEDGKIKLNPKNLNFIGNEKVSSLSDFIIQKGDILISMTDMNPEMLWLGSTIIFNEEGNWLLNQRVGNIRITKEYVNRKYYHYLSNSDVVRNQLKTSVYPNVQTNLSTEPIKNELIYLPPLQEQHQIVEFLDEKTELIDKLISTKERKISLLKEQRTSLINQVVTKGLNPNVKMKDSGVEWIGEIPEHWTTQPIKYLKSLSPDSIVDGPFGSSVNVNEDYGDYEIPVVRTTNITDKGFDDRDLRFMKRDKYLELLRHNVLPNDVLFSKVGTIGNVCLFPERYKEGILSTTGSCRIRVDDTKVNRDWFVYVLLKHKMEFKFLSGQNVQPFLNMTTIKDVKLEVPPLGEQNQIVEYLDSKTKEIDDLVQLEKKKIDLLKEYRQSLISEVVTGKIKVTTDE
jgi:type I restriction enzyme S subunit